MKFFFFLFSVSSDRLLSNYVFYPFKTGININGSNTNQTINSTSDKIYCQCKGSSSSISSQSNVNICSNNLARQLATTTINTNRRKRSTTSSNQVALTQSIDLTKFQAPLQNASKDTCNEILANNPQLILCNSKGIINLSQLVNNCKLDFNSTGIDIWPAKYLESQKSKCKFVIVNDQSFQLSTSVNGQIVYTIPDDIISSLCLNNCSQHGQCSSDGSCVCNTGYAGQDCSVNLSQSPNITYFSLANSTCNTRLENCYEIYFVGNGFSDSVSEDNSLVNLAVYNPIKKTLNNKTNLSSSNLFVLTNEVFFLKLDNKIVNVTRKVNKISSTSIITSNAYSNYTMSVNLKYSNNNGSFSNQVTFLIYDSLCQQCNSTNTCTIKVCNLYIYMALSINFQTGCERTIYI